MRTVTPPIQGFWDFMGTLAIALIGLCVLVGVPLSLVYAIVYVITRAIHAAWVG